MSAEDQTSLAMVGVLVLIGLNSLGMIQQRTPVAQGSDARSWDAALARARQVDVNTADAAELEWLPGIGPSLANRIVAYRTQHGRFHHPEELRGVSGMGPHTFAAIKDSVVVQ